MIFGILFMRRWKRKLLSRSVVLNLGSIEPQGFGESVSRVRRLGSSLGNTKKKNNKI